MTSPTLLVVGGEETEVRLLVKHLNPARYQLAVVACLRKPDMPEQTHQQLEALGLDIPTMMQQLGIKTGADAATAIPAERATKVSSESIERLD